MPNVKRSALSKKTDVHTLGLGLVLNVISIACYCWISLGLKVSMHVSIGINNMNKFWFRSFHACFHITFDAHFR